MGPPSLCGAWLYIIYNVMLWDHRRICGASLTEMSLCGAWLYIIYNVMLWEHRRICGASLTEMSLCGAWLYMGSRRQILNLSDRNIKQYVERVFK